MKTIRDDRLKTCPFCGEDAEIGYFPPDESINARERFYVGCSNEECGCELIDREFKTLDAAIMAWNRRAT